MTQNELMESVKQFFATCQDIIDTRNQKYSNPEDALFNIEQGAITAKLTVERALVHWLSDKVARLSSLTTAWENGDETAAAGILDTLRDISGYAALYNAELRDWVPQSNIVPQDYLPPDIGGQKATDDSSNSAFEKFKSLMGINK